uniref:Uncharacterized protein n=1 Tax=Opuntia streptacantha TaxID=393608 RepID=A0A7C8Z2Q3_OPUST
MRCAEVKENQFSACSVSVTSSSLSWCSSINSCRQLLKSTFLMQAFPRLCGSQKKKNLCAAIRQYICTNAGGISRSCAKLGMRPRMYASISCGWRKPSESSSSSLISILACVRETVRIT